MSLYTPPSGGAFATSKRGGFTSEEIREIKAHRAKERPTPWAALARRFGRCEADIRALFAPVEVATKPALDKLPARHATGRKPPAWTPSEIAIFARVQRHELSVRSASRQLERAPSNVQYWVDRGVGMATCEDERRAA